MKELLIWVDLWATVVLLVVLITGCGKQVLVP
jgi:hypothetical protein